MVMIDLENLSSVLGKKGFKACSGLEGKKCFRPRRDKGRLCKECHRDYMRVYMQKKTGGNRAKTFDGYDFNQENYI